ncbi:MAG: cytochrome bc complex cytochrome b subunit [Candidatus Eiseniibacteriota bacterium]|nr:MAG: cytochrome bc complex cytochrome b subunit [Candidatus Eisenbacteria bacterium]
MKREPVWVRILDWLNDRLQSNKLSELARKKLVPVHKHSFWYLFGGMALFLFLIQVVTGSLLLIYYRSGPESAFESVKFLVSEVPFGWLVRSVHSWSANLMIAILFVHMFSTFLLKSYRKPRELTWITGVLLLFVSMGMGFTGYLLPWNELAFFATKVGTQIAGVLPFLGDFVMKVLRGGDDVTGATLTRFFGFHVFILPAVLALLLGLHVYLVQLHGMSKPPDVERREEKTGKPCPSVPFFPNFIYRDLIAWIFVLVVLVGLAVLAAWELGVRADPLAPAPAGIMPEWYFVFMFQTLKMFPAHVGPFEGEQLAIVGFILAGLFWMFVPFLDRSSPEGARGKLFTVLGICAIAYIGVMTLVSYLVG